MTFADISPVVIRSTGRSEGLALVPQGIANLTVLALIRIVRTPSSPLLSATALALVASCAQSSPSAPVSDAAADTILDAASEVADAMDAFAPSDASDAPDAVVPVQDAPSETDVVDACLVDVVEDEGPCSTGDRQRRWCGRCGREQRICASDGTWGSWGVCVEDPEAECSPCDALPAPCGNCGTQVVWCDTSQDRCRWVRGACDAKGACAAGAHEVRDGTCVGGMLELRWCSKSCEWSEWGPCQTPPRWVPATAAPLAPRSAFAAVGDLLVWGGADGTSHYNDGAVRNGSSDAWTLLPPAEFPENDAGADGSSPSLSPRRDVAAAGDSAWFFVFGGRDESTTTKGDGAVFSPSAGWRPLAEAGAPSPRFGATATVLLTNSRVLVFGGRSGFGGAAPGGALYDPSANAWLPLPAAPTGDRQEHTAVWDPIASRVILWGGRAGDGDTPSPRGSIYDAATNVWLPMADAPVGRAGHTALWDSSTARMIVLFGEDDSWPGHRYDGVAYSPSTDSWAWLPSVASTGYVPGEGAAFLQSVGAIWAVGGRGSDPGGTAKAARLDLDANVWAPAPELSNPSYFLRGAYPYVWGIAGGERLEGYP
jgi:hypothetical protein